MLASIEEELSGFINTNFISSMEGADGTAAFCGMRFGTTLLYDTATLYDFTNESNNAMSVEYLNSEILPTNWELFMISPSLIYTPIINLEPTISWVTPFPIASNSPST